MSRMMTSTLSPPWKMHKSYLPSMNWWIVIAAFRLLNVDDWLCLTMQRHLHLRSTGNIGRAGWRGREAEASSWPVISLARALLIGGPDPPGAWEDSMELTCLYAYCRSVQRADVYETFSVYTTTEMNTFGTHLLVEKWLGTTSHLLTAMSVFYSSPICIIILPPWGGRE